MLTRFRERPLRALWVMAVLCVAGAGVLPARLIPDTLASSDDKALHWSAYALLAAIPPLDSLRGSVWRSMVLLLAVGFAVELAQIFIPGRSFEWADLAANAGGVAAGWLLGSLGCRGAARIRRLG